MVAQSPRFVTDCHGMSVEVSRTGGDHQGFDTEKLLSARSRGVRTLVVHGAIARPSTGWAMIDVIKRVDWGANCLLDQKIVD